MNCNCVWRKSRLNIITANNRVVSEPDVVILPIINMVIGEQLIFRIIRISAFLIKSVFKKDTIFLNHTPNIPVIRTKCVLW